MCPPHPLPQMGTSSSQGSRNAPVGAAATAEGVGTARMVAAHASQQPYAAAFSCRAACSEEQTMMHPAVPRNFCQPAPP